MEAPASRVYVLFCHILLMVEIRLVEVGSWNPIIYKVFIHPRSCRISSINSISYVPLSFALNLTIAFFKILTHQKSKGSI